MTVAKSGDTAKVHYIGRLEDGTIFDTSQGRSPLEFTLGQGQMIPGFEKGVIGMKVGEKRTITLPPGEAYGQPREELLFQVGKSEFPEGMQLRVGQRLQMQDVQGHPVTVWVSAVEEDSVTLDANHALAGKALIFDLELMELNP